LNIGKRSWSTAKYHYCCRRCCRPRRTYYHCWTNQQSD